MATDLVIIGTGGQGRECLEIARAMNDDGAGLNVIGFLDDAPSVTNRSLVEATGYPVLGTVAEFLERPRSATACIGIGNGALRGKIDRLMVAAGIGSTTLVHPASTIGSSVVLQDGAAIWAGARLTTNIKVGRHAHINQNVTVGHDTILGDYVTVNPQAAVSGSVTLQQGCTVGAGAVVLQGISVGTAATVGASACVVCDVPESVVVKGVPAR